MLTKIKTILFLFSTTIFLYFLISYYFSDQHINKINKSRSLISLKEIKNLPLLKNDTEGIIEFKDDIDSFIKNKKKYKFEELIND